MAGHETTAHTLAATLGLLSVHPEIQEEVANQIAEVVGHDRDPVRTSLGLSLPSGHSPGC